jgi:branched-subunit amino acid aminotransferase/4-amino-4-deoxychorismate lyase
MLTDQAVLDSLRFDHGRIFLKRFHVERTSEALALLGETAGEKVTKLYDQIETQYASVIHENQVMRLLFKFENGLQHIIELTEKSFYPTVPKVQLLSTNLQKSGRGSQNYKWQDRSFWNEVLKQKHSEADDVILTNKAGQITETSRCNLFLLDKKNQVVLTPTLDSGCINGVYRRFVMSTGTVLLPGLGSMKVIERDTDVNEIMNFSIYVANSVRDIRAAELLNTSSHQ